MFSGIPRLPAQRSYFLLADGCTEKGWWTEGGRGGGRRQRWAAACPSPVFAPAPGGCLWPHWKKQAQDSTSVAGLGGWCARIFLRTLISEKSSKNVCQGLFIGCFSGCREWKTQVGLSLQTLSKCWKMCSASAPTLHSPGPYLSSPVHGGVDALSLAEMETVVSRGRSASFPSCSFLSR